ncbi:MAG TPA: tRNA (N6-threonylcarbamoyladenosine(37)-N6)-methyltransferase TrmO [Micromonosporaceae bacterium]|jgi:tRNA-Thr(GGU) m(6)t(6)A37 methyltransferase TsaA
MFGTSLACPLEVIGVIQSGRTAAESTPIQAALNRDEVATIELYEPFAEGLLGLAGFDYIWLLTWLHRSDTPVAPVSLTPVPFLLRPQQQRMGLFATRAPRRINPIGLSLVRVVDVTDTRIRFAGVDMLDGTPVVDIKPYVSRFDRPEGEPRCGWFDTVATQPAITPAELDQRDAG